MIQINDLSFYYGSKLGLEISSLQFELGKVYGVIGKNGAGKTTFFKLLTNMLVNYRGTILLNGRDVRVNPEELQSVSVILDDLEVYKDRTGLFNLAYFARLRGAFDEEKARQLAGEIGIEENLGQKVKTYSLGMRRKLILMIALLNDSKVYIFDEPFRGLDIETVEWMKQFFLSLKKQGKLIFISSHVKEDIEDLIDEAMLIENGKVKQFLSMQTLKANKRKVRVANWQDFILFLKGEGISFTQQNNVFVLEITEDAWQAFFQKAVSSGIHFEEMNKISALDTLLKEAK